MTLTRAITVLVVDDHAAVRTGVQALVDADPGLIALGGVGDAFGVPPAVHRLQPDVVVMDYQLPGTDGMSLCRQLRRRPAAPAVLIYSAFASHDMFVPARLAGAGAIIDKALASRELTVAIHRLAAGETLLPGLSPELMEAAAHRIDPRDLPILGMLMADIPVQEIAQTLEVSVDEVEQRVDTMLRRLTVRIQAG